MLMFMFSVEFAVVRKMLVIIHFCVQAEIIKVLSNYYRIQENDVYSSNYFLFFHAIIIFDIFVYHIACSPGYSLVGSNCIHICDVNNPCQNGAACNIAGDSYNCTCLTSWTGQNCSGIVYTIHRDLIVNFLLNKLRYVYTHAW